ncbi:hypothetical protein GTY54_35290, partial [Streptomyces sp. SID625]|nr:hypothetical protein [Streptomyces sp. SID625]
GSGAGAGSAVEEERLREILRSIPVERLRTSGLADALLSLAEDAGAAGAVAVADREEAAGDGDSLDDLDADALINLALGDA